MYMYNVFNSLTNRSPLGYRIQCIYIIVALTGLPIYIGYSVIVALTGLPIGYSVIVRSSIRSLYMIQCNSNSSRSSKG